MASDEAAGRSHAVGRELDQCGLATAVQSNNTDSIAHVDG